MANLENQAHNLKTQQNKYLLYILIWIIMYPILIIFASTLHFYDLLSFIQILVVIMVGINLNNFAKVHSGHKGELKALKTLADLGDDYTIVNDIQVEYEGRKSHIDSVVIGSNGVFVIEISNVKGDITGNENDRELTVHKIGQKGGRYNVNIYNPCKKVKSQVFRLSKILHENNINAWVEGIVYFSNPKTKVDLGMYEMPIYDYGEGGDSFMISYIEKFKKKSLTDDTKKQIIELVKKFIV